MDGIRIIFTKLLQNAVLVGGMAANVNRFQFRNTPDQKSVYRLRRKDIPF